MWQHHALIKSAAKTGDTNIFIRTTAKGENHWASFISKWKRGSYLRGKKSLQRTLLFVVNSIPQVFFTETFLVIAFVDHCIDLLCNLVFMWLTDFLSGSNNIFSSLSGFEFSHKLHLQQKKTSDGPGVKELWSGPWQLCPITLFNMLVWLSLSIFTWPLGPRMGDKWQKVGLKARAIGLTASLIWE